MAPHSNDASLPAPTHWSANRYRPQQTQRPRIVLASKPSIDAPRSASPKPPAQVRQQPSRQRPRTADVSARKHPHKDQAAGSTTSPTQASAQPKPKAKRASCGFPTKAVQLAQKRPPKAPSTSKDKHRDERNWRRSSRQVGARRPRGSQGQARFAPQKSR